MSVRSRVSLRIIIELTLLVAVVGRRHAKPCLRASRPPAAPLEILPANYRPRRNRAYDVAGAIKNLKDSGVTQFKLKAGVMVKKDDRGNVSLVEDRERPLLGTAVGTAAGALIGLIAGAPGAALGGCTRRHRWTWW